MHIHKLMFEVLERFRFEAFLLTLTDNEASSIAITLEELAKNAYEILFEEMLDSPLMNAINERYNKFISQNRCRNPTFDFWSSYIDIVGMEELFG